MYMMISNFFNAYFTAFDVIPVNLRTVAAVIVVIILVLIFINFVRKSLVWLLIFLLLVPTALPAVKQIGFSIYTGVIQPLLR